MPTEPFLINPPKGLRKRRRNPVGETLVTIGANPMRRRKRKSNPDNPWYGDPGGHRIAALMRWGQIPRGKIRKYRKRGRPSLGLFGVRKRSKRYAKRRRAKRIVFSPYVHARGPIRGATFGMYRPGGKVWGINPRKRRSHKMARRRRRKFGRKLLLNTWFGQPRRHRKAAYKGWRRGHKIGGRRVRRYHRNAPATAGNPRRRYRRGYRRNPALTVGRFTSQVMNFGEWLPLAITGGASAVVGAVTPNLIGLVNPWAKLGTQLGVAIGGGMLVENFVGREHGRAWMVVGVSMVGYQLLKQFVLVPYLPQFAVGLGQYEDYYVDMEEQPYQEVGTANPTGYGVSAFPENMSAYPEEVSAYPYDGRYGY